MHLMAAQFGSMLRLGSLFLGFALLFGCNPPSSRDAIERYARGDVKGAL